MIVSSRRQPLDLVSIIKLEDVNGCPVVKIGGIPGPLRVGDPIGLRFRVARVTHGRHEVLDVDGQFRVTAVGFDISTMPRRQLLTVESAQRPPTWRAVKKPLQEAILGLARHPRTPV